jgi:hypothetical protein
MRLGPSSGVMHASPPRPRTSASASLRACHTPHVRRTPQREMTSTSVGGSPYLPYSHFVGLKRHRPHSHLNTLPLPCLSRRVRRQATLPSSVPHGISPAPARGRRRGFATGRFARYHPPALRGVRALVAVPESRRGGNHHEGCNQTAGRARWVHTTHTASPGTLACEGSVLATRLPLGLSEEGTGCLLFRTGNTH